MVTEKNETLRTGRTPLGQIGGEGAADILGHWEDPFTLRFAGPNQHGTPVQFRLSNETRNTSPARKPSLANKSSMARLRLSRALSDGHNVSTKSSCSGER